LINIPTALALSISMSLVPAISGARAVHDEDMVKSQTDLGLRFTFLIGLPCSVGMSLLSKPIISLFYTGALTPSQIQSASELLSVSSLTVILFTLVQSTSAILQGVQKQRIPMYTLIAGVACKIALNYMLVAIPGFHIHGAPISSLVCYTVSMIPNLYYVLKLTGTRFSFVNWIVRPGIATLVMGLLVYALLRILPLRPVFTLLITALGILCYLGVAFAVKAITKEDLSAFRRTRRKK
ncbi:MAG: polysaccharide biosynthesis C-terminal domain-containing protein, partial [Clostridia bacterium]|nr:polysaccharide biosynthesis C-terminal domain-containing protein [Clostridia bacterium]